LSLDKGKDFRRNHARSQSLHYNEVENVHNVDEINLIPDLPERLDELEEFMKEDELEKVFREGIERMRLVHEDFHKKLTYCFQRK
jgi:hypothetical protein|tara:strand:+ start:202 stop:456 length:255 start_codon:yes stop_codon:yes gene_type:complete